MFVVESLFEGKELHPIECSHHVASYAPPIGVPRMWKKQSRAICIQAKGTIT